MLSRKDQSDLEFMLSVGEFEKSPMGGILDKAKLFAIELKAKPDEHLTARITAELRQVAKSDPDLHTLEVYGRASRKLLRVAEVDPQSAAVLVAFYGDQGAKWARGQLGRHGALLGFTAAGKRLIRRSRMRGAGLGLTDAERLEIEVSLQAKPAKESRESLLSQAMAEARALHDQACRRWNEVMAA